MQIAWPLRIRTQTLHLSPRDIIIAMTLLHGTMTGAEVDALRLPLRKKLTAIADLPSHIVAFRGTLGRLTTVGQAPLELDFIVYCGTRGNCAANV